jgi:hypothetical protein
MCYRVKKLVVGMSVLLFLPSAFAWGQIGGGLGSGMGGQGGFGSARGIGGVRGLSGPRSGLRFRSNPIANPAPSLTPHEVFNPQGSLSSEQVFNPEPSLRRPRSGGTTPTLDRPSAAAGSMHRDVRPSYSVRTQRQPVTSSPIGQQLQQSAAALARQLTQVAPNKGWEAYLSVEALRKVQSSSVQPSDAERRELESLLLRYESVTANEKYTIISRLPEFQRTVSTLQAYLKPIDERRRLALQVYFDQLGAQLRRYTNGESWAKYLALPKELLSDETTEGTAEPAKKLLKRLDKLSGDPAYAVVTALVAFEPAHKALKLVVHMTNTSSPPSTATTPQPIAAGDQEPVPAGNAPASDGSSVGGSTQPPATDPAPSGIPLGERILQSVVELDRQLGEVAPNSEWPKRLSLDELRGAVGVRSEQPANDSERKSLEDILAAYQAVAKNNEDAVVNKLPEFNETLEALQEYLQPRDARPVED